jgi:hypothetical protein
VFQFREELGASQGTVIRIADQLRYGIESVPRHQGFDPLHPHNHLTTPSWPKGLRCGRLPRSNTNVGLDAAFEAVTTVRRVHPRLPVVGPRSHSVKDTGHADAVDHRKPHLTTTNTGDIGCGIKVDSYRGGGDRHHTY